MDVKAKVTDLRIKYGAKIVIALVAIILVIVLVFVGNWYAGRHAQELADNLRSQFRQENRGLYDNIAVLKDRTKTLESNYNNQLLVIKTLKNKQKGTTDNVFKSTDKKVVASFFDNTIDNFIPSE